MEARCFLGRHLSDNVGRGGNLGQAKRCPRISARMKLFRFSWKWRKRSAVKITERTHEKQWKHYTPEEKVTILRRYLLDKEPISKLCDGEL